ncbi:FHA domain-containing protein [Ktedonosporobacter rubrisoli]|uniref:FHA domain-containing protein n=1 Tax=Ktedonosporobacter rubrisoli TaxID=2509675 RepID=A0A4P6JQV7_KTERU|nr:FHA domain-containing protein [Ktedonosporobacter rubrisoli]QBD77570.1 FHA domain-containing protein [Ktedonosporobacter rubrisoli]
MEAFLNGPMGRIPLGASLLTLGRSPDNQVVVSDRQASGHHAELRLEGQAYYIVDRGSTNGTFLNEQRLGSNMPRMLMSGDNIRIGSTILTYESVGGSVERTVLAPPGQDVANANVSTYPASYNMGQSGSGFPPQQPPFQVQPPQQPQAPFQGQPQPFQAYQRSGVNYPQQGYPGQPAGYPAQPPQPGHQPQLPPLPQYPGGSNNLQSKRNGLLGPLILVLVLIVIVGAGYLVIVKGASNQNSKKQASTTAVAATPSPMPSPTPAKPKETVQQVMTNYCTYVKREDTHSMYNQLSKRQKSQTTEQQFTQDLKQKEALTGPPTGCQVSNVRENGSTATADATLTFAAYPQPVVTHVTLVKEDSDWKVDNAKTDQ